MFTYLALYLSGTDEHTVDKFRKVENKYKSCNLGRV